MSKLEWAKNEVKLACIRERGDSKEEGWDYGCACYESALKAFKSLLKDNHSGMSIQFTKHILNRLIDGKCLTPIKDTDDAWYEPDQRTDFICYQCKRMSSLFKYVYPDGTVKYHDVDRTRGYEVTNGVEDDIGWSNGFISNLIDDMYPIAMPYCPENGPYRVYCEEFLYDEHNGDFDTIGVLYVKDPSGKKIVINRYFKDSEDTFTEIDENEYKLRISLRFVQADV